MNPVLHHLFNGAEIYPCFHQTVFTPLKDLKSSPDHLNGLPFYMLSMFFQYRIIRDTLSVLKQPKSLNNLTLLSTNRRIIFTMFSFFSTLFVYFAVLMHNGNALFPSFEETEISSAKPPLSYSPSIKVFEVADQLQKQHHESNNQSEPRNYYIRQEMLNRIEKLAMFSEQITEPGTTRPYLSMAGNKAREMLLNMMKESGLDAWADPIGNVIGDLKCRNIIPSKRSPRRKLLLLASHFDTVSRGGKWDGVYGILAGIAVSEMLSSSICKLPFDLRVVGFDDEEGASGFGMTNTGAKAFTGTFNISRDISDYSGFKRQFASMMMKQPYSENDIDNNIRKAFFDAYNADDQYIAALEIHIEQGPILDNLDYAVGAVSSISGQTRMVVTWEGERGHAGTVPMLGRRDALIPASMAVLFVQKSTKLDKNKKENGKESKIVATVGTLNIENAGTNIIPGSVSMSVDVRSSEDSIRHKYVKKIKREFKNIAKRTGTSVNLRVVHEVNAVPMTKWLVDILRENSDIPETMTSGAGHDSQFLSKISDVGMLFLRCKNGISHSPEEYVSNYDAHRGVQKLLLSVQSIARKTIENQVN